MIYIVYLAVGVVIGFVMGALGMQTYYNKRISEVVNWLLFKFELLMRNNIGINIEYEINKMRTHTINIILGKGKNERESNFSEDN